MKFAFYDDYKLGVITDDGIVDISETLSEISYHSPQELIQTVIVDYHSLLPKIVDAVRKGSPKSLDSINLKAPLPHPGQLVCLAGNYIEPDSPSRGEFNAFLKSPTSVISTKETVQLPEADVTVFHFEPELAIVIGKTAKHLTEENALDCVFGYTQFIDVSARGLPGGFFLGKSWHTFAPMGPVLVTADEVTDPNALDVHLWINDRLQHDFSTNSMARFVPELLAEVTNVLTLQPGDVVSTGTHHEALTAVGDGDTVRLAIEGFGPELFVDVYDPLKRSTWRG
ncbi:fumarylacetoacetate hydrolase family protein [Candidatus Poribacteria bacterium]|nr:fumarylacetoacetate hydrolase family protein [Candidatus Poribacteria bacterium]MYB63766.1 fumarylacetoacetate hydrolase family protein [Candidatus Poribacteria bacterium]MYF54621.1 fumarylacetoacetate hydrolase family protein [Candidatus Poribacteria bacterium]MYI93259.1 fumarylacetoacetate hydrolase family protein [Candidatus Poribacteria bacterium]